MYEKILQNYAVQHNVPFRGGRGVSREYTSGHVSINWLDAKLAWQFNYDKSTIECAVSWTQHAAVISLSVHPSLHPRLSRSPSLIPLSLSRLTISLYLSLSLTAFLPSPMFSIFVAHFFAAYFHPRPFSNGGYRGQFNIVSPSRTLVSGWYFDPIENRLETWLVTRHEIKLVYIL